MSTVQAVGGHALDFNAMMRAAQAASGLSDFGDMEFVERAKRWLEIAESEGHLSEAGRQGLASLVTGWLVNRLRHNADLHKHPEIAQQSIKSPIFVTGMPRTGTTKVQRVIACDPAIQSLPFWMILNMAPMPGEVPAGAADPRIAIASGYIELLNQHYPDFMTGHPMFVDEPEEECFYLETDFQSLVNCMRVRAPSYLNEIIDSPNFESYPYLKNGLQYAQWQKSNSWNKSWVLKTPSHVGNLSNLFKTFPDATVVHTYRDPIVAMASICRIFEVFRSMTTEKIDLEELGQEQLALWSKMQKRHMKLREDSNLNEKIVDIHYRDICDNIEDVVKKIYSARGEVVSEQTLGNISQWEKAHPQHQFGKFKYSLERYGLTPEMVKSSFEEYIDRFDSCTLK